MIQRFAVALLIGVCGALLFPYTSQASPERVEVCHRGDVGHKVLSISARALRGHLRHGDVLPSTGGLNGSCEPDTADYQCPFVAELSLVQPIEIRFEFNSSSQDLDMLGRGADGGEGNFDWSILRDGEIVASGERDDHIAVSWFTEVEPGRYSLALVASDPPVPPAAVVFLDCFG